MQPKSQTETGDSPVKMQTRQIRRKKQAEERMKQIETLKEICPKCTKRVAKKGVICETCNTYWHYSCVGTTKNEIETKYRGIPFYCKQHRQNEKNKERALDNGKETNTYH